MKGIETKKVSAAQSIEAQKKQIRKTFLALQILDKKWAKKIIDALRKKPLNVAAIQKKTNELQSNTSQHLSKLRKLDLVTSRRNGRKVWYSLKTDNLEIVLSRIGSLSIAI